MITSADTVFEQVKACGIIAIVRGDYAVDEFVAIGRALHAGGISVIEITLNSAHVREGIPALIDSNPDLLVGAGTVRTVAQVELAQQLGAQFLVSPNFDSESVARSQALGLLHFPGVLTPTEAEMAFRAGCPAVKVFPADLLSPNYIRALRAPLDDIGFVPTGGVDLHNLADYRRAGALAVGAGSTLVAGRGQSISELESLAREWRQTWDEAVS
ncbi:bifunctional 4-hydroxy-2-oxoglutarate aldolase/2-dehydro-3-deoxy-phosphogluconate aldolase [Coraliomargarita akajimensis]|uniref:2-dehydro-3-deoxyphosphogluconate aldolase/4-hydroxy-2-oxoglutarate aldolase n=1 Tax=Coraliomargarita akajimensis (strain DSM 45221 / IAM 15411 / JCM 23193 / KCTC 12865 / 04OKA010-24) TaxID=583355 RepID=D5EL35_CORAD|nr:bifunctional 4-hydroxy-2-oxoglutarate aldolase/2-dehydro-3-deoxy-phosphogluconate aldolase [Coraliomargarita akajimensis]ADE53137.1 2-dehydro-3-deoxyphosphogluconate aldolase/4- hydroxy-2-oxoglutarate aldolase [Coraliomargarita akajimensis DSM 45221]